MAYNDYDDRAGLRGYVQFNKYTHTHTHTHSIIDPPLGESMRVASDDQDDRAGLPSYEQFNKCTHILSLTHTHTPLRIGQIPSREQSPVCC